MIYYVRDLSDCNIMLLYGLKSSIFYYIAFLWVFYAFTAIQGGREYIFTLYL